MTSWSPGRAPTPGFIIHARGTVARRGKYRCFLSLESSAPRPILAHALSAAGALRMKRICSRAPRRIHRFGVVPAKLGTQGGDGPFASAVAAEYAVLLPQFSSPPYFPHSCGGMRVDSVSRRCGRRGHRPFRSCPQCARYRADAKHAWRTGSWRRTMAVLGVRI